MALSLKERVSFKGVIVGTTAGQLVGFIATSLFQFFSQSINLSDVNAQTSAIDRNMQFGLFMLGVSIGSLAGGYSAAKYSPQAQMMNALIAFALSLVTIPFISLDLTYIEQFGVTIVTFSGYVVGSAACVAFAKQSVSRTAKT